MENYNLENDLMAADFIRKKVFSNRYTDYGYRLYATLCNNEFIKNDVWSILQDKTWSCSWRYAGGIVSRLEDNDNYMDYYCSGNEGLVDEEIREDLLKIGWIVK